MSSGAQSTNLAEIETTLFNGYVGSMAVYALSELGYFQLLEERGPITCSAAAEALGAKPDLMETLCRTVEALGIVRAAGDDALTLTPEGYLICQRSGYFTWAIGGYSELLSNLHQIARGALTFGTDVHRDEARVARGAGQVGRRSVAPCLIRVLDGMSFGRVADLGCGSGALLIELCTRYPAITGVGIDTSEGACRVARENIARLGLTERICIVNGDLNEVLATEFSPQREALAEADVVTCFFMLHDLMRNRSRGADLMRQMRCAFKPGARFLFGDTMKTDPAELSHQPVFTLAFELVHAAMGHPIWPKPVYDSLFEGAGFRLLDCVGLKIPSSWLYVLSNQ